MHFVKYDVTVSFYDAVSDEKEGWREGTILATKVGVEDRCVKAPSIRMGTDGHGWTVRAQFWTF